MNKEHHEFEIEVLRIARSLWPSDEYSGSQMVGGQERDGIFQTEECIHLIEATISRKKDKAQNDISKMEKLAIKLQKQNHFMAIKAWFITLDEPTADQRSVSQKRKCQIIVCSFSQFQSKLIDAKRYLSARSDYPFGSVRDPDNGNIIPSIEYIPLDLLDKNSSQLYSPKEMTEKLIDGEKFVLLGDYGAGKSMTLRYIYQELRKAFFTSTTPCFPVYINLRDHMGQEDAAEVIERHCKKIGFESYHQLVRAWRAGYVILLLDGFDEISALGIQGLWKNLKDARYRSMVPLREFVSDSPDKTGIVISGRAHFFDSDKERANALGTSSKFTELSLNEFTHEQIQQYLSRLGNSNNIPEWIPTRPLLIGYLASKGLLSATSQATDPSAGWASLIDSICNRESKIEAGIDSDTIKNILGRLATYSRKFSDGLGPIGPSDISKAFSNICGYEPDERALVVLQRLPGLGVENAESGSRRFIDNDFASACRAVDIISFISSPYNYDAQEMASLQNPVGMTGTGIITLGVKEISAKALNASLSKARTENNHQLMADIFEVMLNRQTSFEDAFQIEDSILSDIEIGDPIAGLSKTTFRHCIFQSIIIKEDVHNDHIPTFNDCIILKLFGRPTAADLPNAFLECIVEEYSDAYGITTASILDADIPYQIKILLTIIKKLFIQKGSGRKEKALLSGLEHRGKRLVPGILSIMEQEKFVTCYQRYSDIVWLPNRDKLKEALSIFKSPNESGSRLAEKIKGLSS